MPKHLVLTINPAAKFDWQRCELRDPLAGALPTLSNLVADAVGNHPGNYLVTVKLEVEVLEQREQIPELEPDYTAEIAAA